MLIYRAPSEAVYFRLGLFPSHIFLLIPFLFVCLQETETWPPPPNHLISKFANQITNSFGRLIWKQPAQKPGEKGKKESKKEEIKNAGQNGGWKSLSKKKLQNWKNAPQMNNGQNRQGKEKGMLQELVQDGGIRRKSKEHHQIQKYKVFSDKYYSYGAIPDKMQNQNVQQKNHHQGQHGEGESSDKSKSEVFYDANDFLESEEEEEDPKEAKIAERHKIGEKLKETKVGKNLEQKAIKYDFDDSLEANNAEKNNLEKNEGNKNKSEGNPLNLQIVPFDPNKNDGQHFLRGILNREKEKMTKTTSKLNGTIPLGKNRGKNIHERKNSVKIILNSLPKIHDVKNMNEHEKIKKKAASIEFGSQKEFKEAEKRRNTELAKGNGLKNDDKHFRAKSPKIDRNRKLTMVAEKNSQNSQNLKSEGNLNLNNELEKIVGKEEWKMLKHSSVEGKFVRNFKSAEISKSKKENEMTLKRHKSEMDKENGKEKEKNGENIHANGFKGTYEKIVEKELKIPNNLPKKSGKFMEKMKSAEDGKLKVNGNEALKRHKSEMDKIEKNGKSIGEKLDKFKGTNGKIEKKSENVDNSGGKDKGIMAKGRSKSVQIGKGHNRILEEKRAKTVVKRLGRGDGGGGKIDSLPKTMNNKIKKMEKNVKVQQRGNGLSEGHLPLGKGRDKMTGNGLGGLDGPENGRNEPGHKQMDGQNELDGRNWSGNGRNERVEGKQWAAQSGKGKGQINHQKGEGEMKMKLEGKNGGIVGKIEDKNEDESKNRKINEFISKNLVALSNGNSRVEMEDLNEKHSLKSHKMEGGSKIGENGEGEKEKKNEGKNELAKKTENGKTNSVEIKKDGNENDDKDDNLGRKETNLKNIQTKNNPIEKSTLRIPQGNGEMGDLNISNARRNGQDGHFSHKKGFDEPKSPRSILSKNPFGESSSASDESMEEEEFEFEGKLAKKGSTKLTKETHKGNGHSASGKAVENEKDEVNGINGKKQSEEKQILTSNDGATKKEEKIEIKKLEKDNKKKSDKIEELEIDKLVKKNEILVKIPEEKSEINEDEKRKEKKKIEENGGEKEKKIEEKNQEIIKNKEEQKQQIVAPPPPSLKISPPPPLPPKPQKNSPASQIPKPPPPPPPMPNQKLGPPKPPPSPGKISVPGVPNPPPPPPPLQSGKKVDAMITELQRKKKNLAELMKFSEDNVSSICQFSGTRAVAKGETVWTGYNFDEEKAFKTLLPIVPMLFKAFKAKEIKVLKKEGEKKMENAEKKNEDVKDKSKKRKSKIQQIGKHNTVMGFMDTTIRKFFLLKVIDKGENTEFDKFKEFFTKLARENERWKGMESIVDLDRIDVIYNHFSNLTAYKEDYRIPENEYKMMNATAIQEYSSNDQYFWFIANFEELRVKNADEINIGKKLEENERTNKGMKLTYRDMLEEKIHLDLVENIEKRLTKAQEEWVMGEKDREFVGKIIGVTLDMVNLVNWRANPPKLAFLQLNAGDLYDIWKKKMLESSFDLAHFLIAHFKNRKKEGEEGRETFEDFVKKLKEWIQKLGAAKSHYSAMVSDHMEILKLQKNENIKKFDEVNKKIRETLKMMEAIFNKDNFCHWIGIEKMIKIFEKKEENEKDLKKIEKVEKEQNKQLSERTEHYKKLFQAFDLLGITADDWKRREKFYEKQIEMAKLDPKNDEKNPDEPRTKKKYEQLWNAFYGENNQTAKENDEPMKAPNVEEKAKNNNEIEKTEASKKAMPEASSVSKSTTINKISGIHKKVDNPPNLNQLKGNVLPQALSPSKTNSASNLINSISNSHRNRSNSSSSSESMESSLPTAHFVQQVRQRYAAKENISNKFESKSPSTIGIKNEEHKKKRDSGKVKPMSKSENLKNSKILENNRIVIANDKEFTEKLKEKDKLLVQRIGDGDKKFTKKLTLSNVNKKLENEEEEKGEDDWD